MGWDGTGVLVGKSMTATFAWAGFEGGGGRVGNAATAGSCISSGRGGNDLRGGGGGFGIGASVEGDIDGLLGGAGEGCDGGGGCESHIVSPHHT
jgi:hypothetical protein